MLPRWLGWAALVLGIVMFAPADFAFLGFVLSGVWIVVVSIVIWRGEAAVAPARPRASVMEAHWQVKRKRTHVCSDQNH